MIADFVVAIGDKVQRRLNSALQEQCFWPSHYGPQALAAVSRQTIGSALLAGIGDTACEPGTLALVHSADQSFDQGLRKELDQYLRSGRAPQVNASFCKFAAIHVSSDTGATFCTDPMRGFNLFYAQLDDELVVATDMRLVMRVARLREPDEQAIYHYLNFAQVPTPHTLIKGIKKLAPGSQVCWRNGQCSQSRYWQPRYPEDLQLESNCSADALYDEIEQSIKMCMPSGDQWGTFLSGGNDSSTITGVLSNLSDRPVASFSIGFNEEGYDELPYALAAADAFSCESSSMRVSAADTLAMIPKLIQLFDEPFGNASAIPTYFCAQLASQSGMNCLIAGDGGDEIFGGNERYSKDAIFQRFYNLPKPIKSSLTSLIHNIPSPDVRVWNRVRNFVYRGSLPNPERFYTDDAFASEFFEQLLSDNMQKKIQRQSSLEVMQKHYNDADAQSELHRLMYIDLQMAICDNDLTKVNRSAKGAGVSVLYPFLSPQLLSFTGRLPAKYKVSAGQKRVLFKQASARILPEIIQNKPKQGFGLPVSIWLREDPALRELVHDTLLSNRAKSRGYVNAIYVESILSRHDRGAWDYSQEIWMLLILELWLMEYVDDAF